MTQYVFKLPDLGEGTVESEIGEWFVKVGDLIEEETIVGTMMTDKAAVEVSSPVSGRIVRLAGEPGDIVAVGAPLVVFETDAPAADTAAADDDGAAARPANGGDVTPADRGPADEPSAAPGQGAGAAGPGAADGGEAGGRVITSPAIRRRAKEHGVDLNRLEGSGPNGRILRQDFDAFLATVAEPATPKVSGGTREIKVIGLRRIIAERMSASKREIPHFSYVEEIDITELEALRVHMNERAAAGETRLTLLPFLGLALIRALRRFPQCNATYDKERNVIVRHDAVHLGVATQTPDGLKVPVVRHAERRNITELAAEMRRVAEAARDNSAKKDELTGSTITITSLGKLGGIASTPVINMPEVGIIGVNRAVERPAVYNGQIAVRLMMNLSTSFDHRFVDGYDAAAMVQDIKDMLEHPATIFVP
ncbi:MAG TPA: dihydrolipoamide acetyltransferase family protein [Woeseiaceae bacterium]|nr:dihydrolipoamide acetyltransferase family protein [Woeseiaceae bacterium]